MREALLGFIARLREAGVRISVAESLDAAHAVAAAGLERIRLREALAAALDQRRSRPAGLRSRVRSLLSRASPSQPDRTQTRTELARDGGRARAPVGGGTVPPVRKPDPQPRSGQKSVKPSSNPMSPPKSPPPGNRTGRDEGDAADSGGEGADKSGQDLQAGSAAARNRERKPSHSASTPISIMSRH